MEREKLMFKVGDLVKVDSNDYVGNALVVGFKYFGCDGDANFAIFKPMVPFGIASVCVDSASQKRLTLIRHIEMPEMDVVAVDATAEVVTQDKVPVVG